MIRRPLITVALLGASVAASHAAITFSNFVYDSAQFEGAPSIFGNALTWLPTEAAFFGDLGSVPSGSVTFSYDALSDNALVATNTLGQTVLAGTGSLSFTQTVYALDAGGNVTGTLGTLTSADEMNSLSFAPTNRIRVETTFALSAIDNIDDFDLSGLTLVNQNVSAVPGPAALAAFALGQVGVLRRRSRRKA